MDTLLESHQNFARADLEADRESLARLLADDFQSIGEQGYVLDKAQWIARHDDFAYTSVETSEVDVRRYERCAVIRAIQRTRATWQGQDLSLSTRTSQVWVEQEQGWQLVAVQFSSLPEA